MFVSRLSDRWRERAEGLRPFAPGAAEVFFQADDDELEEELHAYLTEALTPDQAAHESGYHPESVREKIRSGMWPNAGKRGSPWVRRMDLQRKGGGGAIGGAASPFDEIVREAVSSRVASRLQRRADRCRHRL